MNFESMNRRQAIAAGSGTLAGLLAMSKFGFAQEEKAPLSLDSLNGKRILFFSKSAGFEHSVVKRENGAPSYADRMMAAFAKKYGFEVALTKDGRVFDSDYQNFDCFLFYTTGDLTDPNVKNADQEPPMSKQGKENLLKSIRNGKGFAGAHCASDTFHSSGKQWENQDERDPYIAMIGGEFAGHGEQQLAKMVVVDPNFPGVELGGASFSLLEEWYSLKNLAPDMHVILLQDTSGMKNFDYERPPYPATWARREGEGRVFYTSMGHREDVWTNPIFESVLMGGLAWASGALKAEVPPNLEEVAPEANTLPKKS